MAEIYQLPENGNNNSSIPFSIPIGVGGFGNGFGFGNGGFNSIADLFGLGFICSMFNGGGFGSPIPSIDFLKKKTEEDENKENEQVFAIPAK